MAKQHDNSLDVTAEVIHQLQSFITQVAPSLNRTFDRPLEIDFEMTVTSAKEAKTLAQAMAYAEYLNDSSLPRKSLNDYQQYRQEGDKLHYRIKVPKGKTPAEILMPMKKAVESFRKRTIGTFGQSEKLFFLATCAEEKPYMVPVAQPKDEAIAARDTELLVALASYHEFPQFKSRIGEAGEAAEPLTAKQKEVVDVALNKLAEHNDPGMVKTSTRLNIVSKVANEMRKFVKDLQHPIHNPRVVTADDVKRMHGLPVTGAPHPQQQPHVMSYVSRKEHAIKVEDELEAKAIANTVAFARHAYEVLQGSTTTLEEYARQDGYSYDDNTKILKIAIEVDETRDMGQTLSNMERGLQYIGREYFDKTQHREHDYFTDATKGGTVDRMIVMPRDANQLRLHLCEAELMGSIAKHHGFTKFYIEPEPSVAGQLLALSQHPILHPPKEKGGNSSYLQNRDIREARTLDEVMSKRLPTALDSIREQRRPTAEELAKRADKKSRKKMRALEHGSGSTERKELVEWEKEKPPAYNAAIIEPDVLFLEGKNGQSPLNCRMHAAMVGNAARSLMGALKRGDELDAEVASLLLSQANIRAAAKAVGVEKFPKSLPVSAADRQRDRLKENQAKLDASPELEKRIGELAEQVPALVLLLRAATMEQAQTSPKLLGQLKEDPEYVELAREAGEPLDEGKYHQRHVTRYLANRSQCDEWKIS